MKSTLNAAAVDAASAEAGHAAGRGAPKTRSAETATVRLARLLRHENLQDNRGFSQASHDYLQQLFKQAPGFICVLRGPNHVFELANDACHHLLGRAQLVGHELKTLLPELVEQGYVQKLDRAYRTGTPFVGRAMPILLRRQPEGNLVRRYVDFAYQPIHDPQGCISGIFVQGHDVTDAHQLALKVSYENTHDTLTGLLNRREFTRQVQALLAGKQAAPQGPHSLLYMDIDQFKIVNDRSGHVAGDALLRQVAISLQQSVRQTDLLARLGGDEFALVLPDCPPDQSQALAERLRADVDELRFSWEGRRYGVSISIGIAPLLPGNPKAYTQALSQADAACFLAKEKGRNRIHLHHDADAELTRQRRDMDWASLLREAMRDDRIILFSQQIHSLQSRNTGVLRKQELLARMVAPDGTLIQPGNFITAAERYGLMPLLDRHIVRKAMAALSGMAAHERSTARYFINLSGATLSDESLPDFIESTLAAFPNLSASQICFEITETAAVNDLGRSREAMLRLISQGFSFALDDFGSGMSSFTYLRELPVQYVKIDGAFITAIVSDPVSAVMVESVARVARAMGIKTIAEFVESTAILQRLIHMDIDFAQGYGLCIPTPLPS